MSRRGVTCGGSLGQGERVCREGVVVAASCDAQRIAQPWRRRTPASTLRCSRAAQPHGTGTVVLQTSCRYGWPPTFTGTLLKLHVPLPRPPFQPPQQYATVSTETPQVVLRLANVCPPATATGLLLHKASL
jgi:hypothetical protein